MAQFEALKMPCEEFVYFLYSETYINFELHDTQRYFRITTLLFPETDSKKAC